MKHLILAELAKKSRYSPRSMKLAIIAAIDRHRIFEGHFAKAIGLDDAAISRGLHWELDTRNIGYIAAALGYEARGSYAVVYVKRTAPPPALEVVPPAEVLELLRKAVRRAGSLANYALRCAGVAMCTKNLRAIMSGKMPIGARYLTPLGITRRPDGTFVREVAS